MSTKTEIANEQRSLTYMYAAARVNANDYRSAASFDNDSQFAEWYRQRAIQWQIRAADASARVRAMVLT